MYLSASAGPSAHQVGRVRARGPGELPERGAGREGASCSSTAVSQASASSARYPGLR